MRRCVPKPSKVAALLPGLLACSSVLGACNAVFDITEGVPAEGAGGSAGPEAFVPFGAGQGGGAGNTAQNNANLGGAGAGAQPTATGGNAGNAGNANNPVDPGPSLVAADALTLVAGLIPADSNTFGIDGYGWTFRSVAGTVIDPDCATVNDAGVNDCFQDQAGRLCVSGSTQAVPLIAGTSSYNYEDYWGATLALYLHNLNGPWDRGGARALGVSFRIEGPAVPRFRFQATSSPSTQPLPGGDLPEYCAELAPNSGDVVQIRFANLRTQCWPGGGGTALADGIDLEFLGWQIFAVEGAAKSFDFCISDIRPLVAAP